MGGGVGGGVGAGGKTGGREEGGQGGFLLEDSTATYRSLDTYISIYLATLRGIDIRQVSIVKRGRSWEIGES